MPELPEVERARALIAARALHRTIASVDDTDTYVCRPHAPGEIADALVGRELLSAERRGKSMWCDTSGGGPALGLHLGMAGRIVVDEQSAGDREPEGGGPPARRWDRFTIHFADGGRLVLRDRRRLGRVRLEPAIDRLGPDLAEVSRAEFRARVGRGRTAVKARIMDQAVIAGVGNLLADEALWRAAIDPRRPASELAEAELDRLRNALRAANRSAIAKGGVHTGAVIPARRRDGVCPRCGTPMARGTVGGRTTYWCPAEQR
jgi:formamidopyrimidine-DNA glycosylase